MHMNSLATPPSWPDSLGHAGERRYAAGKRARLPRPGYYVVTVSTIRV